MSRLDAHPRIPARLATTALAALAAIPVLAHPVPDIPVRAVFAGNGKVTLQAEIDPRCFADDPLNEPYLENSVFQTLSAHDKQSLIAQASKLLSRSLEIRLSPGGPAHPPFRFQFTTFGAEELRWDPEAPQAEKETCAVLPVMITAQWTGEASEFESYQVHSTEEAKFSVQVITRVRDQLQPLNVLFPGEKSARIDLGAAAAAEGAGADADG